MTVLFTSARDHVDPCVPAVLDGLAARGARVVNFDTAAFPSEWRVTVQAGDSEDLVIEGPEGRVLGSELSAAWTRYPDSTDPLHALDPEWRDVIRGQAELTVWEALDAIQVFQVESPTVLRRQPGKLGVLRLAQASGLVVPRTRLSNDPESARALLRESPLGVVAKLLDNNGFTILDEAGERQVFTMALSPDQADDLDRIALSPMIIQERIAKHLEVRVTAIGRRLFAAAAQADEGGHIDMSANPDVVVGFKAIELPHSVERGVQRLLDRMGLQFATVDLLVTREGDWRFLEVNTTSHYDFIERSSGMPITAALVDLLVGEGQPR